MLPVYAALEHGLARHATSPAVGEIHRRELARLAALEHDVAHLAGAGWRDLPLTPAALHYAARIETAALGAGELLIAHAYVRYFGDLSGGQVLKRLIAESFRLRPEDLRFYEFDDIDDPAVFKQGYRQSFDRAMRAVADPEAVLEEAVAAFEFNIRISDEVRSLVAPATCAD